MNNVKVSIHDFFSVTETRCLLIEKEKKEAAVVKIAISCDRLEKTSQNILSELVIAKIAGIL